MSGNALEDAFGALVGEDIDDSHVTEKLARREAKFHAAVLEAKATYRAKIDSDAWFVDSAEAGGGESAAAVGGMKDMQRAGASSARVMLTCRVRSGVFVLRGTVPRCAPRRS